MPNNILCDHVANWQEKEGGNREDSVKAVNASCKSAYITTSGTARQTKALSFHPFVKAHYHSFTAVCSVVKLDIK